MFLYPYFVNLDSSDKVIRTVASLQEYFGIISSKGRLKLDDVACRDSILELIEFLDPEFT